MSRLAYDAVAGVRPVLDVPPRPAREFPSLAGQQVIGYPATIHEQVTAELRRRARAREAWDRQAAFLLFGVHL